MDGEKHLSQKREEHKEVKLQPLHAGYNILTTSKPLFPKSKEKRLRNTLPLLLQVLAL